MYFVRSVTRDGFHYFQRDNVVKCFRSGKIWILICTELMGRGIDFKGVNLVINYDFPNSAISYIHRIGKSEICIYGLLKLKNCMFFLLRL